jgi:four helix bundle protein
MSGTYEDLTVWKKGMELVFEVYAATQHFPKDETYGLSSQMRRCAVSIPSNIAEGKGRTSDKELLVFLSHSRGSLYELNTQILITQKLNYIHPAQCAELTSRTRELGRILNGYINAMRNPNR